MNKGYASGFISSDIKSETISTKNGDMKKTKFSIACSRKSKEGGADFPWFEAFGKTAENIEKYFSKGRGIFIEYHIQTGKYQNKEGKTIFTESKIVDTFEFPPVRKDEENSTPVSGSDGGASPSNDTHAEDEDFMNVPDDIVNDLPFR